MNKMLAGALAVASTSALLGVVTPAAHAADGPDNCVSYPPGQPYGLTESTSPRYTTRAFAPEKLTVRAQKGSLGCAGYKVVLFAHYQGGPPGYHSVPDASPLTSGNGYNDIYPANTATYGYFWFWRTPTGTIKETRVQYVIVE